MDSAELEALLDEIRNGLGEGHALELKEKWWDLGVEKSRDEFVKDVASMANANTKDAKVILVGVDQAGKVRDSPLPEDEANLQQRLQAIAPVPHVVFRAILLPRESATVTAIEIHEPFDKPYVARMATFGDRHIVWVRQGSRTATATRGMLDRWYEAREKLPELRLLIEGQDVASDPVVAMSKPHYMAAATAATYPMALASRPLRDRTSLDRIILDPSSVKEPFMGRFKSDPVEDAEFMNREHRLEMALENSGAGSAQNVIVDFRLAPAERVRVETPGPEISPRRVWETDEYEDSHVEGGEARVRQRLRQLNPKTRESLDPIGIVLSQGHLPPNYRVSYRITDSKGLRLEGEFRVEVEWDSEETLESEKRLPF